jgi:hypothetical protein
MKGIIGCEESQAVTLAFIRKGHDFYSNDIQDCSGGYQIYHIKGDFFKEISRRLHVYDFCGGHPPCTYLANSGVRWLVSKSDKPGFIWNEKIGLYYNPERWAEMEKAAVFF